MFAITEYNYLKSVAGVPTEMSNYNRSLDYERNKKCTSVTVIVGIVQITLNNTLNTTIQHDILPDEIIPMKKTPISP